MGFAMTKPLPYGYIKLKKGAPTLDELKDLSANVTLEDKIGHLFVVDIFFSLTKRQFYSTSFIHLFLKKIRK